MGYTAGVEPYSITAEYHDVLYAESHRARAGRLLGNCPGTPRHGVLELGAGSGLATTMIAGTCPVPVQAVETRRPLRALLHTRLVASGLTARVTVHDSSLPDLALAGVADLAVCHGYLTTLAPEERAETWLALAAALLPGGCALVELPVALAGPHTIGPRRLGGLCYDGTVRTERLPGGRVRWHVTYRVSRHDTLVRVSSEALEGWLPSREELLAELAGAGLRADRVGPEVARLRPA